MIEVTPVPCIVCGRGNVQDDRDPIRFVDFERDVNWNDPVVICEDCIARAGGMVGMLSQDERAGLHRDLLARDGKIHALEAEKDSMRARAKRIGMKFEEVA